MKTQHKDLATIEVIFRRAGVVTHVATGRVVPLRIDPSLDDIPRKVVKGDATSMATRSDLFRRCAMIN